MEPKTIVLHTPVTHGDLTISELTFSRPLKGKDMRGIPLSIGMEHLLLLAGRVCGQPPSVMEQLEGDDLLAVLEIVGHFFGNGQLIGRPA